MKALSGASKLLGLLALGCLLAFGRAAGASAPGRAVEQGAERDRSAAAQPAAAETPPRRTVRRPILGTPGESAGLPWRLFRRFGWANSYSRSYVRVRSAFRDAVRQPSQSTVKVLCDGKQVALGAVVSRDGSVLTKASELSDPIRCVLADGREIPAEVAGRLPAYDIALLKTDARDLTPVSWSDGAAPPPGSWVATPGLDDLPLAIGIVSVSPRRVIGPPAMLGVFLEQAAQGPQIASLQPGGGAEKAGLRVDDVVTHVNGGRVATRQALIETVRRFRPGDKVKLSVLRGDQSLEITATLGAWADESRDEHAALLERLGGPLSQRRADFPLALQHDSVLLPSACGGPLVDLDGKVIGINIARADRVSSYAIPASVVKLLLKELQSGPLAARTPPAARSRQTTAPQATTSVQNERVEHRVELRSSDGREESDRPGDDAPRSAPPP